MQQSEQNARGLFHDPVTSEQLLLVHELIMEANFLTEQENPGMECVCDHPWWKDSSKQDFLSWTSSFPVKMKRSQ
ncbi:uncharacterized protein LOC124369917 isoform X2 [Homalodisca vitripennis]|uniref:uncharacterized protein LOC124369917 isoform X2 n=1 Tax=Homalodisca vitripennis TaxID=197043 RepID=UPI001EEC7942|nr:uncharacterized protein LOC124369917 isoform X2 [Homalodisca vitripennis]